MATLGTGADSFIYKSPEFGPRRDFDPLGDLQRTNNELKRISDTVEAGRTRARLLDHYLPALVGGAMRPDTKQLEAAITTLNLSATVSPDAQGNWRISDDQAQKLSDVVQRTELIYKEGAISAQTRNNLVNAVSVVVDINTKTAKILASGPSTEQFNAADRALQGIQTSNQRLQDRTRPTSRAADAVGTANCRTGHCHQETARRDRRKTATACKPLTQIRTRRAPIRGHRILFVGHGSAPFLAHAFAAREPGCA
jgi:hypothetical protein